MHPPRITVVVPAFCEERLIATTLRRVPPSVAEIIVVDDASSDRTSEVARSLNDPRVVVLRHEENRGVGAAIYSGYQRALLGSGEVFVVMAGDNQMDESDLPSVVGPLVSGQADYVKGNRLVHSEAQNMPPIRRWGSRFFARLTSWASGAALGDTQCGYTGITRAAARSLAFEEMWESYGYPNDLLITLLRRGFRVEEVPVRPVYASEASGLRAWHFFSILYVIVRRIVLETRRARRQEPLVALDS